MKRSILSLALLLMLASYSLCAAESHPTGAVDDQSHPQVPEHPTWVDGVLLYVGVLFVCAAVVGPIVALYRRPEPVVSGHDEHSHSHEAHEHTSAGLDKHGAHDPHAGHGGHH